MPGFPGYARMSQIGDIYNVGSLRLLGPQPRLRVTQLPLPRELPAETVRCCTVI
jgi:hypothetical protein